MQGNIVLRTLEHAWATLGKLHEPMAVMDGIALAAWKHVRATQDVDLLVGISGTDVEQLLRTLGKEGLRPKRTPAVISIGALKLIQLLYEPPGSFLDIQVDLLLADSEYHKVALSRRVPTKLEGLDVDIFVLTCEDLILHKLLAGRIIDRVDCVALLSANRAKLDRGYLEQWAIHLGIAQQLSEVLAEAFPADLPKPE